MLQELELDAIYGYRGFDCRNNVMYLNDGADIVYHAAGACIVLNLSSGIQIYVCPCILHSRNLVARNVSILLNSNPFSGKSIAGR